jgi:fumarate hydratase class I
LAACKEHGCVYLHAVGGAAQVLAEHIHKVPNVYMMEQFGAPEAIWEFAVDGFPAVVTMDAHGNSLHKEVFAASEAELARHL